MLTIFSQSTGISALQEKQSILGSCWEWDGHCPVSFFFVSACHGHELWADEASL